MLSKSVHINRLTSCSRNLHTIKSTIWWLTYFRRLQTTPSRTLIYVLSWTQANPWKLDYLQSVKLPIRNYVMPCHLVSLKYFLTHATMPSTFQLNNHLSNIHQLYHFSKFPWCVHPQHNNPLQAATPSFSIQLSKSNFIHLMKLMNFV